MCHFPLTHAERHIDAEPTLTCANAKLRPAITPDMFSDPAVGNQLEREAELTNCNREGKMGTVRRFVSTTTARVSRHAQGSFYLEIGLLILASQVVSGEVVTAMASILIARKR